MSIVICTFPFPRAVREIIWAYSKTLTVFFSCWTSGRLAVGFKRSLRCHFGGLDAVRFCRMASTFVIKVINK